MNQQPTITIPASTADKLAALGRAMLDLAQEMKQHEGKNEPIRADLHNIPDDQRWFWTPEWQAGEREAEEALANGDYVEFNTAEEAIAYLHRAL